MQGGGPGWKRRFEVHAVMFTGYNPTRMQTLEISSRDFSADGLYWSAATMNTPEPNEPLARTLAAWRVNPPMNPNFRPAVWQMIQQRARETWASYVRAHRLSWSLVALVAVMAAGWTGRSVAQAKLDAEREEMVVSYLGNLDPRVMAKLRP